jgi:hypothetical protein
MSEYNIKEIKMKTTCKPCITIRTFFFLLRKNYNQFRKELKDYSYINQMSCEMPKYKAPKTIDEGMAELKHLREVAKKNYSKEKEEELLKSVVQ